jgi:hypothetical protein
MRNKTLLAMVMAGFLVGACGGDGTDDLGTGGPTSLDGPVTTAPPTTSRPGPDPEPGPAATTTTTTSGAPGLTAASTLDLRGLGPVRIGMTPAEATAAAGIPITAPTESPECTYAKVEGGPAGVDFMLVGGRIVRVDVHNGSPVKTRSGAGIGDTEAQVQATYPGIEVSAHKYVPAGRYLTLVPTSAADQNYRLIFATDGTQVTAFHSGQLPEVGYIEGCS